MVFRPPLCTYLRPNWARRTSRGWWDEWDDTALQTQDSEFERWSEAELATSRSRRLPTLLNPDDVAGAVNTTPWIYAVLTLIKVLNYIN